MQASVATKNAINMSTDKTKAIESALANIGNQNGTEPDTSTLAGHGNDRSLA